ncbi:MAG: hypothetical protein J5922_04600, partial [Clostridia bacterium]|nr:hypothetical protein [Clostridia bacterium]
FVKKGKLLKVVTHKFLQAVQISKRRVFSKQILRYFESKILRFFAKINERTDIICWQNQCRTNILKRL